MAGGKRTTADVIRVTLLGTGVPTPVMERFGPGTLVEAGGEILLFDAGRGVIQRLFQIQTPLKKLRSVFLTHLHSDHIVGLPDLWLTGWLTGRPEAPLQVWGPRGTRDMMTHLELAFQYDIRIRLYDDRTPPEGVVVLAEDIAEGVVYEHNGVVVTAIEVDHAPIRPAFGYRIDYAGHSVVLSGDTRFSEHLIERAQGVDVIVHEVIAADLMRSRAGKNPESLEAVIAHHTTPEQAGEVFARINPRLAVYTHIIPVTATDKDVIPPTRQTYAGPLEMGEDLMVINVGDRVTVRRMK
jgi:ribonuclease Z